jgi:hypothetical protein
MLSVLLIEDNLDMIDCMTLVLEDEGFAVKSIVGVRRPLADEFIALLRNDNATGLGDYPCEEIDLSQYLVAIVDGQVIGKFMGWDIVPALREAGLICIGSSNDDGFNRRMREAGAQMSCDKGKFMSEMVPMLRVIRGQLEGTGLPNPQSQPSA